MKQILMITLFFFSAQLFANYAFNNDKTIKIDMHGGKSEQMINTREFSRIGSGGLQKIKPFMLKQPKEPTKPEKKDVPQLEDIKLK
ncbi:hypothetical protein ALC152_22040 [Arcobacter sp. 15-2]|uniref:hypothetical protein n=1 Tax=Arcobacter sp. 15-2 TaxID=3374109 RepID=UPI00399C5233